MSSRRAIVLASTIVSSLFVSSRALANPIVVAIDDPDHSTWEAIQSAAQTKLRELGWQPTDEGISGADLAQCLHDGDDDCVRDLIAELPGAVVLLLRLPTARTGRASLVSRYVGSCLIARPERKSSATSDTASGAYLDRLLPLVADLVESIIHERASQLAPDTNVTIHSTPPQARVMIDGVVLGPSGTSYAVSPGPHTIRLDPASRQIHPKPNQSQTLRIQLLPLESTGASAPPHPAKYRIWKWVCLGSGVATLGFGLGGEGRLTARAACFAWW